MNNPKIKIVSKPGEVRSYKALAEHLLGQLTQEKELAEAHIQILREMNHELTRRLEIYEKGGVKGAKQSDS